MTLQEIRLPDIGDFKDVEIIELLVAPGDPVEVDGSLLTLESDKASMEIPAPFAGTVRELHIKVGDRVNRGDLLLTMETTAAESEEQRQPEQPASANPRGDGIPDLSADVLVLGAGPGGYTAAFRAADLGLKVVLVERHADLGGVCLNVGCIPSKALLHTAEVIEDARALSKMGVRFGEPEVDLDALRAGKDKVVKRLTGGLAALAKQRKVEVVHGVGKFTAPNRLQVSAAEREISISFNHAIIAAGSRPVQIPGFPHEDPRLIDSTGALALQDIPKRMLVVGGGIIGLEMATVYSTLGSQVDIVELQGQLIPGCDPDLVRVLQKHMKPRLGNIWLNTKVLQIKAHEDSLEALLEGDNCPQNARYDKILVAVGRRPNGHLIGAEQAGVQVDERGFIPVDGHMRTNVPNIYAIGDVVGNPMLAHKATHEAKVAAEVIAGLPALFDPLTIPSVAYTDPEVAWMGLTEQQAKEQQTPYEKGVFPWAASGRALGLGRDEGFTKLLFDPDSRRIIGAGIVGRNAGELIGETVLALEMGADAEDIGLTIHPHPTLNETVCLAAEMAEGSITDLMPPRKR